MQIKCMSFKKKIIYESVRLRKFKITVRFLNITLIYQRVANQKLGPMLHLSVVS
jgi:hypothetical protein